MHTYSGRCWDDRGSHYSLWRRQEGGSAQPQAVRWARPAWNFWWRTHRDTHCTYVLTHAHWNSLADRVIMIVSHTFFFFCFWVRTVITVITVPLWITYCQCTHTQTQRHTHFRCYLPFQPLLLCFYFSSTSCYWCIPDMTEPPSRLAPHGCLSASRQ